MKDVQKEFGPSSWAIDNKTAVYVIIFLITVLGLVKLLPAAKGEFSRYRAIKSVCFDSLCRTIASEYRIIGDKAD